MTLDNALLLPGSILVLALAVVYLAFVIGNGRRRRHPPFPDEWSTRMREQAAAMNRVLDEQPDVLHTLVQTETRLHAEMMQMALTTLNISGHEPEGMPSGFHLPEGVGQTVASEVTKKLLGTFNRWVGVPGSRNDH